MEIPAAGAAGRAAGGGGFFRGAVGGGPSGGDANGGPNGEPNWEPNWEPNGDASGYVGMNLWLIPKMIDSFDELFGKIRKVAPDSCNLSAKCSVHYSEIRSLIREFVWISGNRQSNR